MGQQTSIKQALSIHLALNQSQMYGSLSKVLDDRGFFFFKESFAVSPFINNFFGIPPMVWILD